MQDERRPHSGTLRALINNDLGSIPCALRVGVIIYLLLYLCLWAYTTLFYYYRARSQAQQLQVGHLRWETLTVYICLTTKKCILAKPDQIKSISS